MASTELVQTNRLQVSKFKFAIQQRFEMRRDDGRNALKNSSQARLQIAAFTLG